MQIKKSIPKLISTIDRDDVKKLKGRLCQFYSDVLEKERYDGVARIKKVTEVAETFYQYKQFYQVIKFEVEFLTGDELKKEGINMGGYFNDPFANISFKTHRRKKVFLTRQDSEVPSLAFKQEEFE
jgi:hypothetical protein